MHSSDFFCTAEVFILAVCAYLADLQAFAVDEKTAVTAESDCRFSYSGKSKNYLNSCYLLR